MTANPKPTAEADVGEDDLTVCERLGGSCFVAYDDGRNDYTLAEEAIAEIARLHTNIDGLTRGVNTMACMVEEKEAEITRLREQLTEADSAFGEIADGAAPDHWVPQYQHCVDIATIARAHLASNGLGAWGAAVGAEDDCVDKAEAWDAISAKNAEITHLRENLREGYDAFCSMRNDLNEMFGDMISQEATLAEGPTMSAECAAVVVALSKVRAELREMSMQALTDLGQAWEAQEAKLRAEGELAEARARADVAFAAGIEAAVRTAETQLCQSCSGNGYRMDLGACAECDGRGHVPVIHALTPPDITAAAARVLLAGPTGTLAPVYNAVLGEVGVRCGDERETEIANAVNEGLRAVAQGEK